jgi:hypothetical protein
MGSIQSDKDALVSEVIELKRRFGRKCLHGQYILDPDLATVECGKCGLHVHPISVLTEIMHQKEREKERIARLYLAVKETEKKLKTKCEHCQKITKIRYRLSDWKIMEETRNLKDPVL